MQPTSTTGGGRPTAGTFTKTMSSSTIRGAAALSWVNTTRKISLAWAASVATSDPGDTGAVWRRITPGFFCGILVPRKSTRWMLSYRRYRVRAGAPSDFDLVGTITKEAAPSLRFLCQVPGHPLQIVPGHPLQISSSIRGRQPAFDRGRTLAVEIEFAHQGAAVVDQYPLSHSFQPHPFSTQGSADIPVPILEP
jgi:hypothetical protein